MRGGKREGAGRPDGARSKAKITDYMSEGEIDEMVNLFISQCREKPDLMKFLMEQIFGKARQNIGLDGGEENKPISILQNVIQRKKESMSPVREEFNEKDLGIEI